MPATNTKAACQLESMRKDRDLTYAWIARRLNRNGRAGLMWVRRRLQDEIPMSIDDYNQLWSAINSVVPMESLLDIESVNV